MTEEWFFSLSDYFLESKLGTVEFQAHLYAWSLFSPLCTLLSQI